MYNNMTTHTSVRQMPNKTAKKLLELFDSMVHVILEQTKFGTQDSIDQMKALHKCQITHKGVLCKLKVLDKQFRFWLQQTKIPRNARWLLKFGMERDESTRMPLALRVELHPYV